MKAIIAAVRKLEKSSTRLTRKRARAALRSAVNAALRDFPPIGKDGQEKTKSTAPTCPLCRIPCKDYLALARHLHRKHSTLDKWTTHRCPGCKEPFNSQHNVALHLAGLDRAGKLLAHVVPAATEKAFA